MTPHAHKGMHPQCLTQGRSTMCDTRAKTCNVRERRAKEAEASKSICETVHNNHIAKRRRTIEMENRFDFIHHMATIYYILQVYLHTPTSQSNTNITPHKATTSYPNLGEDYTKPSTLQPWLVLATGYTPRLTSAHKDNLKYLHLSLTKPSQSKRTKVSTKQSYQIYFKTQNPQNTKLPPPIPSKTSRLDVACLCQQYLQHEKHITTHTTKRRRHRFDNHLTHTSGAHSKTMMNLSLTHTHTISKKSYNMSTKGHTPKVDGGPSALVCQLQNHKAIHASAQKHT